MSLTKACLHKHGYHLDTFHCLEAMFKIIVTFLNVWFLLSLLWVSTDGNAKWIKRCDLGISLFNKVPTT